MRNEKCIFQQVDFSLIFSNVVVARQVDRNVAILHDLLISNQLEKT